MSIFDIFRKRKEIPAPWAKYYTDEENIFVVEYAGARFKIDFIKNIYLDLDYKLSYLKDNNDNRKIQETRIFRDDCINLLISLRRE